MLRLSERRRCAPPTAWLLLHGVALLPLVAAAVPVWAQGQPETVGKIEGADISLHGAISVDISSGRNAAVLASGSEVTVRSGQARLELPDGSELGICGPAHFSLLKSGGAITVALDQGRIHARLESAAPLGFYTPLIVATPVAIAEGPREATVALDLAGAMCIRAARGAVRIEQQLTGQSLLVPQNGEVTLAGGQLESLRNSTGACVCEALAARAAPSVLLSSALATLPLTPPSSPKRFELGVPLSASLARAKPPEKVEARGKPKPPAVEEPVYTVLMPPLTFDASKPVPPPDPSPETMLLVRQVRVRPAVYFRGRVEAPAEPPEVRAPAPPVIAAKLAEDAPKKKGTGLVARIWGFFRRLSNRGAPCAGVGCDGGGK